jgi:alkylation response protein AidB-like acyl-CoA dehydrogenase
MSFLQSPPELGNQYAADLLLREYLERTLPPDALGALEPELFEMGELSAGELARLSAEARKLEPEHVPYDAWGRRIDAISVPRAWKELARIACERGLVAIPYERKLGALSRVHQFALAYLFAPSSCVYTCALAMTDGAARALEVHANAPLLERAFPRLVSREPARAWTSGQWMTERTGGSDVGLSETVARRDGDGFRLYGTKWFTSATTSEMALTLARPEGNPSGGKGLALFYLELRDEAGHLNGIRINRLKEKLGTRLLPTAELELDGAAVVPVAGLRDGVRAISPMLQVTRLWNALCSAASLRHGLALAQDYASRRVAFGQRLADKPLQREVLTELEATFASAFHLTARAFELLGREETAEASDAERTLSRLLQPLVKLTTAKDAVAGASEVLEAFGGAGYIEDTGLPVLLRDAQVLPIWEGTTNVLALDVLRVAKASDALELLAAEVARLARGASGDDASGAARVALGAVEAALAAYRSLLDRPEALERAARALSFTLARSYGLALALDHAEWLRSRGRAHGCALVRRLAHAVAAARATLERVLEDA